MSEANGDMHAGGRDGHGLWICDNRYLSEYRLLIDGQEPVATVSAIPPCDAVLSAFPVAPPGD